MQVLGLLDTAEAATVSDVQEKLGAEGLDYAYTTVMTVLTRLCDKGVARRQKVGTRYVYRSTPRSGELKRGLLQRMQRALFSDRKDLLVALVDQDLSEKELKELRSLIDARLKRK